MASLVMLRAITVTSQRGHLGVVGVAGGGGARALGLCEDAGLIVDGSGRSPAPEPPSASTPVLGGLVEFCARLGCVSAGLLPL
jgi:hypothetical protein